MQSPNCCHPVCFLNTGDGDLNTLCFIWLRSRLHCRSVSNNVSKNIRYPFLLSVLFLYVTFSILSIPFHLSILLRPLPFTSFFLSSFHCSVFPSSIICWSSVVLTSCYLNVMPSSSLRKPSCAAQIYLSNSLLLSVFSVSSGPVFRHRSAKQQSALPDWLSRFLQFAANLSALTQFPIFYGLMEEGDISVLLGGSTFCPCILQPCISTRSQL